MKQEVNVEELLKRLNIALECKQCPRYTGAYSANDKCKGHLVWLCGAIKEVLERNGNNG